jgi:radical SAM protein with 4Fe4S-binding SPASM domain
MLLEGKVHVGLKTILMTANSHEFFAIRRIAEDLGVRFRSDAEIFPRIDGDRSPLGLRVPPREAIEREFSDLERRGRWQRYAERTRGAPVSDRLYTCGAGTIGFHVDAGGRLQPCLMVQGIGYDLTRGSFSSGWRDVGARIGARAAGAQAACNSCEKRHLCNVCPGFFELETGSERVRSDYVCAIGSSRYERIDADYQGEGRNGG